MEKWTEEEVNYLINNYSNKTNKELSIFLNKDISVIETKRYSLNLHKSKEHKSEIISKRNKTTGRDLSFEFCKNEALKYKTRSELQLKDSSLYVISRTNGWLDIICNHMIKKQYSIPQLILSEIIKNTINNDILYDTRKIIKPYEIDIFIPKYNLAFEYDGKGWHLNNKNDEIKNNLCKEKNIKLIRIVENNRKYESDIKKQFIKYLDEINDYCKIHITSKMVLDVNVNNIFNNILDDNDIMNITKKYNNYTLFKKENPTIFFKLYKFKLLDKYTSHMKKYQRIWTKEEENYLIKNYKNISNKELMDYFNVSLNSIYQKASKLGLKKVG